jgi:geranylgeranyl pyrophosphate synthase
MQNYMEILREDDRIVGPIIEDACREAQELLGSFSLVPQQAALRMSQYVRRSGRGFSGSIILRCSLANSSDRVLLAAGLELYNAALLMLDDVIDRSVIRKSVPTPHELYRSDALACGATKNKASRYGQAQALQLSQALSLVALRTVARARGCPSEVEAIAGGMIGVVGGMLLEQRMIVDDSFQKRTYLTQTYLQKTGLYSFGNAFRVATCSMDLAHEHLISLDALCGHLGLAFQYLDDFDGLCMPTSVTGKPVGDDQKNGTFTSLDALGSHDTVLKEAINECSKARACLAYLEAAVPATIRDYLKCLIEFIDSRVRSRSAQLPHDVSSF